MRTTFRVSTAGRLRAAILLLTLLIIAIYSGRKALGLWAGLTAKPSDIYLFNLNLNTTVPALLLTLLALACLPVAWYLIVELLTEVKLSEAGLLLRAPGYRIFYRWNQVRALDVISGPAEDATVCLQVETDLDIPPGEVPLEPAATGMEDEIAAYLSEADLREDKVARQRARAERRLKMAALRSLATRPDGSAPSIKLGLLYPQIRRPDRLLLYPALEDRNLLLAEIEYYLAKAENLN